MALVNVVSGIIENNEEKFLLVTEKDGRVKFPTKHFGHSDPFKALINGIWKETGFTIDDKSIRLLDNYIGRGSRGDDLNFFDFYARTQEGLFVPNKEISAIDWVDTDYLKEMQKQFSPNQTHYHRIDLLLLHKHIE